MSRVYEQWRQTISKNYSREPSTNECLERLNKEYGPREALEQIEKFPLDSRTE